MDTSHLAWSTPLLLVLGAVVLGRLPARVATPAVALVVVLLAPTWTSHLAYLSEPRAAIAVVEAPATTVRDVQATVDDIQQRTRSGEPIFVYPTSPLLYVLADRPNPTRFDHLNPGAADARKIDWLILDLSRSQTSLVVISDYWRAVWGVPGNNTVLEAWLEANYVEVGRHGSYRLLAAHSASLRGRLRL